jgi:hypothetical protein
MNQKHIKNTKLKLQRRYNDLMSMNADRLLNSLPNLINFFEEFPLLRDILCALITQFPDSEDNVDLILSGNVFLGDSYDEQAAIGYSAIRRFVGAPELHWMDFNLPFQQLYIDEGPLHFFKSNYLKPIFQYISESLEEKNLLFHYLRKYKQRSEWFFRDYLWNLREEAISQIEKPFALDLYCYLFDQGIDLYIEPSSLTGEIDMIAAQDNENPVLAEVKIFDDKNRNKSYLLKGLKQLLNYTDQYNEAVGYLIVFNVSETQILFPDSEPDCVFPVLNLGNRSISIVVLDIFPHNEPISRRKKTKTISILKSNIQFSEETEL